MKIATGVCSGAGCRMDQKVLCNKHHKDGVDACGKKPMGQRATCIARTDALHKKCLVTFKCL